MTNSGKKTSYEFLLDTYFLEIMAKSTSQILTVDHIVYIIFDIDILLPYISSLFFSADLIICEIDLICLERPFNRQFISA